MGKKIHYLPGDIPSPGDILSVPEKGMLIVSKCWMLEGRGARFFIEGKWTIRLSSFSRNFRFSPQEIPFDGLSNSFSPNQWRHFMKYNNITHAKKNGEKICLGRGAENIL